MKIDPVNILLNKDKALNKKFYFISGNEITLMKKIEDLIIEKLKREQNFEVLKIETFDNFVNQEFLPEEISNTKLYEPGNNQRENSFRTSLKQRWKDKYNY